MNAERGARFAEVAVEALGDGAVGSGDVRFEDSYYRMLASD